MSETPESCAKCGRFGCQDPVTCDLFMKVTRQLEVVNELRGRSWLARLFSAASLNAETAELRRLTRLLDLCPHPVMHSDQYRSKPK
jgi:hypothetical protein